MLIWMYNERDSVTSRHKHFSTRQVDMLLNSVNYQRTYDRNKKENMVD